MFKQLVKNTFRLLGLNVEWRDRLAEQIPNDYVKSPYLPRLYMQSFRELIYKNEMVRRVADLPGDIVECGVSVGHGLLALICANENLGIDRHYYGFDSFAGFPPPRPEDQGTHAYGGFYANEPEIVLRVLEDARLDPAVIRDKVHLVKGFFDQSLRTYERPIALLHLDCDLYQSYMDALRWLYDRVVPGGLILFDEYEDPAFPGGRKAIDEFLATKPEQVQSHPVGKSYIVKQNAAAVAESPAPADVAA